jgi:hypothetical protein
MPGADLHACLLVCGYLVTWVPTALHAQKAEPDSAIVVELGLPKPAAIERVMAAMTGAGLQIAQSEATGLVVGVGDGPKNTTVAYSATVLTVGDGSRVVLSAYATSKASLNLGGTSFTPKTRVTSKTKGGDKVWAQLQRLGVALQAES